jgi:hypothetical protein
MRIVARVHGLTYTRALLSIGFAGVLILGWAITGSTTLAQEARPTLTPVPTPLPLVTPAPPSQPEQDTQPQALFSYTGPLLKGRVYNVKTGEAVGSTTVVFVTGGVSVEVVSNESGEYAFEHLGTANGVLNVVPPGGSGLRPVTRDVAVRPRVGVETIVNLGVSPNGNGAPPLIPSVQLTPGFVGAGEFMTVTVMVKNTLPHAISDAVITNWLPDRVVPIRIHASTGNPYFSENLAIAELGTLEPGSGALVEIVAQANGGGSATSALQGQASFFYRESAAGQAKALGGTIGEVPTVLPVTGVGMPVIGLALIVVVLIVGWMRRKVGSTATLS